MIFAFRKINVLDSKEFPVPGLKGVVIWKDGSRKDVVRINQSREFPK